MEQVKKYRILKDKKYKHRIAIAGVLNLYRIQALIDFGDVKAGDIGGYVQSQANLSHEGDAWVYDNAEVFGHARVFGDAKVYDNAKVFGHARVFGNAKVYDNARVFEYAIAFDNAEVSAHAILFGYARVGEDATISGAAQVFGNAQVNGSSKVYDHAQISCDAEVAGNAKVFGKAEVIGDASISGDAEVSKLGDYIVFKNNWSSGYYFTYTRSNRMWNVGCFHGTGEELIKKAYADSEESGKKYSLYVKLVNDLELS